MTTPSTRAVVFTVPGHVVPWQRTDGARRTRKSHRDYKQTVGLYALEARQSGTFRGLFSGAVEVRIKAFIYNASERCGAPCTKTPDGDNLLKIVKDALSGVLYQDDRQVSDGSFSKRNVSRREDERLEVSVGGVLC